MSLVVTKKNFFVNEPILGFITGILILESLAYFWSAYSFCMTFSRASNWNSLTPVAKSEIELNVVMPLVGYGLAALALIFAIHKIPRLYLIPLWAGLLLYGGNGLFEVIPFMHSWLGVFTGDLVAIGAAQYAGFLVLGILGFLKSIQSK